MTTVVANQALDMQQVQQQLEGFVTIGTTLVTSEPTIARYENQLFLDMAVEFTGTGFTYDGNIPTGGTVNTFKVETPIGATAYEVSDFSVDISDLNDLDLFGDADTLIGSAFNDVLFAGDGADTLTGGRGKDSLFGEEGLDTFVFESKKDSRKGGKADTIEDFSQFEDDLIDLAAIDAKKGGGNQKFKWIGKKDFHEKKGELHYVKKKGVLIVEGDIKGNGKADFQIKVDGPDLNKLFADDFVL